MNTPVRVGAGHMHIISTLNGQYLARPTAQGAKHAKPPRPSDAKLYAVNLIYSVFNVVIREGYLAKGSAVRRTSGAYAAKRTKPPRPVLRSKPYTHVSQCIYTKRIFTQNILYLLVYLYGSRSRGGNKGAMPPTGPVKTSQKKDGCDARLQVSQVMHAPPLTNFWIRYWEDIFSGGSRIFSWVVPPWIRH